MKKYALLLYFLLTISFNAFCIEKRFKKSDAPNYLDSTLIYLKSSIADTGVNEIEYIHGLSFLDSISMNKESTKKLELVTDSFIKFEDYYVNFYHTIYTRVIEEQGRKEGIDYMKSIIERYQYSSNTVYRYNFLNTLLELRIPLREFSVDEAFDYYTKQLSVYLKQNDSNAITICYFSLGTVYRMVGLLDMTIYNFKKATVYINKEDIITKYPISGLSGYVNNVSVLGQLYLELGEFETAIKYSVEAKTLRLNKLKNYNVSYLNCNIALAKIKLKDYNGVLNLLHSALSQAEKEQDYPSLVRICEVFALYYIDFNEFNSAEFYLWKEKKLMKEKGVNHFSAAGTHKPNYYLALIQYKQNKFVEASKLLEDEIPQIINIRSELLKEYKLLIEVYNKLGKSKEANDIFNKYTELQSVLYSEERKYRSKSFEVESKIESAESTIGKLLVEQKISTITRRYLIGIVALLILVSVIIFNRFRVTRRQKLIIEKEKKRSDELLLNILPEEVAEELKEKGFAQAKQFDLVTVMFTDFKGFTQIAEKLSPEELVAEIDYCFKSFDDIITKYGIEKIKTIGDSYMCAGGLPVSNKTNPKDVVNAAIEIQQFMLQHALNRKEKGMETFEIRIGVHTGPVVAGIVGIKKFAYDIWGDTVNLASRMESSGEVGKVNISQMTFELIQDEFNCIPRGKIQAKNKGEIEMYFVEKI